jgi:hypothetical protein
MLPQFHHPKEPVSLCEVLDRVLNKGVVLVGEAMISVAGVDLLYLRLQVVLTSLETALASQDANLMAWRERPGND